MCVVPGILSDQLLLSVGDNQALLCCTNKGRLISRYLVLVFFCKTHTHGKWSFPMCTNKRWITNQYTGDRLFVPCGHCPACLQKKANTRANKINHNFKPGFVALFVHLTYSNDCVPYIYKSDLDLSYDDTHRVIQSDIPIWRDSKNRRIRTTTDYNIKKHRLRKHHVVGYFNSEFECPTPEEANDLPILTNMHDDNKLGVIFYHDVQCFIKRLSIYVIRRKVLSFSDREFSYHVCAEYGENLTRPHFHLLIFVKSHCYKYWAKAIAENWLYDDYNRTIRNIEVAKNAAKYVASYINCYTTLPSFLQQSPFKPKYSHSLFFGQASNMFQLSSILSKIERGDLTYPRLMPESNGSFRVVSVRYPSYVLRRYFPKFKGFSRLTDDQIQDVLYDPVKYLKQYQYLLGYKLIYDDDGVVLQDDYSFNCSKILHAQERFFSYLDLTDFRRTRSIYQYCFYYISVFRLLRSQAWHFMYDSIKNPIDNIFAYDNLNEIYDKGLQDEPFFETLKPIVESYPGVSLNPNTFSQNVADDLYFSDMFYRYDKAHKVNQFNNY